MDIVKVDKNPFVQYYETDQYQFKELSCLADWWFDFVFCCPTKRGPFSETYSFLNGITLKGKHDYIIFTLRDSAPRNNAVDRETLTSFQFPLTLVSVIVLLPSTLPCSLLPPVPRDTELAMVASGIAGNAPSSA